MKRSHLRYVTLFIAVDVLLLLLLYVTYNDERWVVDVSIIPDDRHICTQWQRRERILEYCERHKRQLTVAEKRRRLAYTLRHVLVDDKNGVMFCSCPKTGSTFLHQLWISMNGDGIYTRNMTYKVHIHKYLSSLGLRYLITYSPREQARRIRTHFKFMISRHPATRLLSAYREKVENRTLARAAVIGQSVVRHYARGDRNRTPTFSEFLRFVFRKGRSDSAFDHHWTSVERVCSPCLFEYDYYAKLETIDLDLVPIFAARRDPDAVHKLPPYAINYDRAITNDAVLFKYYNDINISSVVEKTINTYYADDYNLFGYKWDNVTFQAQCSHDNQCC